MIVDEDPVHDIRESALSSLVDQRIDHLLSIIQPEAHSELHRLTISAYICNLIKQCFSPNRKVEVFLFGSVPLRTYLPDGDIDISLFSPAQGPNDNIKDIWANRLVKYLEREQARTTAPFRIRSCQIIQAEVKLLKCIVGDAVVDISFNTLGGVCAVAFLEWVDRHVGKDHLFKRSIVLVKAWCYYESRLLGAHHGLISSYALEAMVLYVLNIHGASLESPLQVLQQFLEVLSTFDWNTYCMSMLGPIPLNSFPHPYVDKSALPATPPLLDETTVRQAATEFSVHPSSATAIIDCLLSGCNENINNNDSAQQQNVGGDDADDNSSSGSGGVALTFSTKYLNLMDPLLPSNNLGRSVSKASYARIIKALNYSSQMLNSILSKEPMAAGEAIEHFFRNTWRCHAHTSTTTTNNNSNTSTPPHTPTTSIDNTAVLLDGFPRVAQHQQQQHVAQMMQLQGMNPAVLLTLQQQYAAAAASMQQQQQQHGSSGSNNRSSNGQQQRNNINNNSMARRHSSSSLPDFLPTGLPQQHQHQQQQQQQMPVSMWIPAVAVNDPRALHARSIQIQTAAGYSLVPAAYIMPGNNNGIASSPQAANLTMNTGSANNNGGNGSGGQQQQQQQQLGSSRAQGMNGGTGYTSSASHHSRGGSVDSVHSIHSMATTTTATPLNMSQPPSPLQPAMVSLGAHSPQPEGPSVVPLQHNHHNLNQQQRRPVPTTQSDVLLSGGGGVGAAVSPRGLVVEQNNDSGKSLQRRWLADLERLAPPPNTTTTTAPGGAASAVPVAEPSLSIHSMWSSNLDALSQNLAEARQCHAPTASTTSTNTSGVGGSGTSQQQQKGGKGAKVEKTTQTNASTSGDKASGRQRQQQQGDGGKKDASTGTTSDASSLRLKTSSTQSTEDKHSPPTAKATTKQRTAAADSPEQQQQHQHAVSQSNTRESSPGAAVNLLSPADYPSLSTIATTAVSSPKIGTYAAAAWGPKATTPSSSATSTAAVVVASHSNAPTDAALGGGSARLKSPEAEGFPALRRSSVEAQPPLSTTTAKAAAVTLVMAVADPQQGGGQTASRASTVSTTASTTLPTPSSYAAAIALGASPKHAHTTTTVTAAGTTGTTPSGTSPTTGTGGAWMESSPLRKIGTLSSRAAAANARLASSSVSTAATTSPPTDSGEQQQQQQRKYVDGRGSGSSRSSRASSLDLGPGGFKPSAWPRPVATSMAPAGSGSAAVAPTKTAILAGTVTDAAANASTTSSPSVRSPTTATTPHHHSGPSSWSAIASKPKQAKQPTSARSSVATAGGGTPRSPDSSTASPAVGGGDGGGGRGGNNPFARVAAGAKSNLGGSAKGGSGTPAASAGGMASPKAVRAPRTVADAAFDLKTQEFPSLVGGAEKGKRK